MTRRILAIDGGGVRGVIPAVALAALERALPGRVRDHFDFVAGQCAEGIQRVSLETEVPVIFGVLTTEDLDQALCRSEPEGGHNVGEESARTAVEMVNLRRQLARPH